MSNEVKKTKSKSKFGNLPGPGPGRPLGSENRFSKLKDAFLDAFYDEDGFGGAKGLKTWLSESKRNEALFVQMITKMLPSNITLKGDEDNPIVQIIFKEAVKKGDGKGEEEAK